MDLSVDGRSLIIKECTTATRLVKGEEYMFEEANEDCVAGWQDEGREGKGREARS